MSVIRSIRRLIPNRDGAAAVEFALICPLLIWLMAGMVVYGGWFWLAHSVQSLAAEGARAAVAGLNTAERESLARAVIGQQMAAMGVDPAVTVVSVDSDSEQIRVSVAYDASEHPLLILASITPPPPRVIVRTASVRTGGY